MAETSVIDFVLPSLGSDMEEGTVIEWKVAAGDAVARGDTLLSVETEKSDIDVETWDTGVIAEICVPPGTTVLVGDVLARITVADGHPPPNAADTPGAPAHPDSVPATPAAPPTPAVPPSSAARSPLAGPAEPLVSPRLVYWPAAVAVPAARVAPQVADEDRIADPMRRAIARIMARSNREIPHYHLLHDIDLDIAQRWLEAHNETVSVAERMVLAALLVKATARAARAVPELNARWTPEGPRPFDTVDIGIITRLRGGGLAVPVIAAADTLELTDLMRRLSEGVTRAKQGTLRSSDLTDASITITNLGDRGVQAVMGVIHPPQVALVGFGRPEPRPTVVDGQVVARPMVTASLAGDHRATDGQAGARFLRAIDLALQEPEHL